MTSKERFLTAMRNGVPDQVPVSPDISNYIPARMSGLPFWRVYFTDELPLWRAYLSAADYFKLDMWVGSCLSLPTVPRGQVAIERTVDENPADGSAVRRSVYRTPDGDLRQEEICFAGEPPTHRERLVKDLERDWTKLRWLLQEEAELDLDEIDAIRLECEERKQAFGLGISFPGFQNWEGYVEGSVMTLTYAEADLPHILEEWMELQLGTGTRLLEEYLSLKPDYLTLGGSGTLTLASPELARKYALPAIQNWSAMCREAGVPTVLHSCGRSWELVKMLAEESDVSCINPLEMPPMGDTDLGGVKRAFGDRIALMGNLHTTDTMLRGTADQVYQAAADAISAAGPGGGFILSTGDQCPRDTPDENIFALHKAVEDAGRYA